MYRNKKCIENGRIISSTNKNSRIFRIYDLNREHYIQYLIGTNGFIVSVYPGGSKK